MDGSVNPHAKPTKAVIYCRVSSVKQKTMGSGLDSQEHRCRQYAEANGYSVTAVFPDDASGGGDFMKRPGMVALLSFLDAQPAESYTVIFDDLKRFARDTQFHIMLRNELAARGARVECLNFKFEDTPEGRFTETIFAAQGELEREQNRRQTIQKMKARLEKGYWVFRQPIGYRYIKSAGGGRVLVKDEPLASIITEALEGFASGRFETQAEVKRFLEQQPEYPKDYPDGQTRNQRVAELLNRTVYAGMVESQSWNVSVLQGQHEGLISLATYQAIQDRLNGRAKAPVRKDINGDFPLRGFVYCSECNKPLTACWSTSRTGKRHPYYWCKTRGCTQHRKSIRRDQLEEDFAGVLRTLQPRTKMLSVFTAMFRQAWDTRMDQVDDTHNAWKVQLSQTQKKIDGLLDRIVESTTPSVIAAYEKRIADLETEAAMLAEKCEKPTVPRYPFEQMFELATLFLSNPCKIWDNGSLAWKRIVLKLAFSDPISYHREKGVRTANFSIVFKVLNGLLVAKSKMAGMVGFEPTVHCTKNSCLTTWLHPNVGR